MMGSVTPNACRVILHWNKSYCTLLHLVGLLFNLNYDARNHELKIQVVVGVFSIMAAYFVRSAIKGPVLKYMKNLKWDQFQSAQCIIHMHNRVSPASRFYVFIFTYFDLILTYPYVSTRVPLLQTERNMQP